MWQALEPASSTEPRYSLSDYITCRRSNPYSRPTPIATPLGIFIVADVVFSFVMPPSAQPLPFAVPVMPAISASASTFDPVFFIEIVLSSVFPSVGKLSSHVPPTFTTHSLEISALVALPFSVPSLLGCFPSALVQFIVASSPNPLQLLNFVASPVITVPSLLTLYIPVGLAHLIEPPSYVNVPSPALPSPFPPWLVQRASAGAAEQAYSATTIEIPNTIFILFITTSPLSYIRILASVAPPPSIIHMHGAILWDLLTTSPTCQRRRHRSSR